MRAVERFCRYAAYDTQSSEASEASPSTEKQLVLDVYKRQVLAVAVHLHGDVIAVLRGV